MIYKHRNFSYSKLDNLSAENGDEFIGCNFSQANPHTDICEGVTGLTFRDCNLCNCDVPQDAECIGCTPRHISRCTNIEYHASIVDLIDHTCDEDCEHVVDTDTVTIDGVVVDTIYYYEDTAVE